MPTKEELSKQLEELKINDDIQKEFTKQKTYLMNRLRNFVGIEISDKEISSIFCDITDVDLRNIEKNYYHFRKKWVVPRNLRNFFENENNDNTVLIARQFYNKYANHYQIRYEDSEDVINIFLMRLSDEQNNKNEHNWESRGIIPLFI